MLPDFYALQSKFIYHNQDNIQLKLRPTMLNFAQLGLACPLIFVLVLKNFPKISKMTCHANRKSKLIKLNQ